MFNAITITKDPDYSAQLAQISEQQLPAGDVTVKVEYSTINYKDALAITGKGPVVRQFPMVPGIDFAGVVIDSQSPAFNPGDKVLLNGWGVGELHFGGLSQLAKVKADWLIKIPDGLSAKEAMSLGTAGYTAMLCVQALAQNEVNPDSGDIIVSGAMGGVGSVAISLLAKRGYNVYALTGRPENKTYLTELGAKDILARDLYSASGKHLQKERWAGAIDVAGSHTLANICAAMQHGGVVTACGLAQGMDFPATVAPFILRGVSLLGIDSVYQPQHKREQAWQALAKEFDMQLLNSITTEITLDQVIEHASLLLDGKIAGRLLVNMS